METWLPEHATQLHYTNMACIVLHYSHDIKYELLRST